MSFDLNKPLGRKSSEKRPLCVRVSFRLSFNLLFYFCIIVLSIYIYASNWLVDVVDNTEKYFFIREIPEVVNPVSYAVHADVNIEESMDIIKRENDDGRDQKDSSLVNRIIGQYVDASSIVDSIPDVQDKLGSVLSKEDLVEKSDRGYLPIRGKDGSSSFEYYANTCPRFDGARIAIVVSGLGISQTGTQRAIDVLPKNITLSFASNGNSLKRWMQEARIKGHEILLQVPMESFGESSEEDDPYTLRVRHSPKVLLDHLYRSLERMKNYIGVMNYRGDMFLSDKSSSEVVFKDLAKRGLMFFDDGISARNFTKELASRVGLPYAIADFYLDDRLDHDSISKKIRDLENLAHKSGKAIGIAVAFDESIEIISRWIQKTYARNDISVVPLSCLVKD
ncbi:divergent polysaccharide deacetylase family protein [Candidatus Liberibacter sp.]|uniref:divergent polysaccharide deacetylase family protein n=1 Tax=Candidatus Liberibacter sp. TaxID=34022 RepID=UPI0015F471C3|nr:divergent polysaccharide deacetylase family protein [Candidatus Liberibacter sp.]MBA5723561.1 divergent polysaccharide deacetylase family protein [Candidatus Liberibacter sp.]